MFFLGKSRLSYIKISQFRGSMNPCSSSNFCSVYTTALAIEYYTTNLSRSITNPCPIHTQMGVLMLSGAIGALVSVYKSMMGRQQTRANVVKWQYFIYPKQYSYHRISEVTELKTIQNIKM